MIENKRQFDHFGFFMVRTSTLDSKLYEKIHNIVTDNFELENIIRELELENKKDFVFEAILVSSPDLMESIINYEKRNTRQKKQITKSLLNYLNRMSSRATPYGLMASVGFGEFQEQTKENKTKEYFKEVCIDSEWLQSFIDSNITNPFIITSLMVKVNPTICIKDNNFIVDVRPPGNNQMLNVVLPNDPFLKFIQTNTKKLININRLVENIQIEFKDLDITKIKLSILKLLECGFLICDFQLLSNKKNSLEFIKEKIDLIDEKNEVQDKFYFFKKYLKEYEKREVGEGVKYIDKLNNELRNTFPVKNPIQVNLFENNMFSLSNTIGEEMKEVADVLFKISREDKTFAHLKEYKHRFIQQYGYKREVSLKTLLDEDKGLGAPSIYLNYNIQQDVGYVSKNDLILMNLLNDINQKKSKELVLTDEIIEQLTSVKQKTNIQNTLELYFEYIEGSNVAINNVDYSIILGPNIGTRGAGKTFARFDAFFESILNKKNKNVYNIIKKRTSEDVIYAELKYLPDNPRLINLLPGNSSYPYQIPINCITNDSNIFNIELDDILVGIKNDTFYLKSKKLKKQIIPIKNHMINHYSFPNIVRFLCEMEYEGQDNWTPFDWGVLENQTFLPRVKYKNTILYSARWLFSLESLSINTNATIDIFIERFNIWKNNNAIPKFINIGKSSSRLIYDTENFNDLKDIFTTAKKLKKNEVLTLVESNRNFKTEHSSLLSQEIVLPLYSINEYKSIPNQYDLLKEPVQEIKYFPGSIWSSFKIYINKKRQDEFISKFIVSIIEKLKANNLIEKWYFLKYRDPKNHIRLRVKGLSNNITQEVITMLNDNTKENMDVFINDITIDTYKPEIEKYGGRECIDLAEDWFMKDSEAIIHWINPSNSNKTNWTEMDCAIFSVIDIIDNFDISRNVIITWIDSLINYNIHLTDFRKRKPCLMQFFNKDGFIDYEKLPSNFVDGLITRKKELLHYSNQINEESNKYDIFTELIHMNLNRIYGPDKFKELKTLGIVRHLLKTLENRRLHSNEL